jgi:hypothetical protein
LAGSVLAEGGAMFSLGLCAVFLSIAPSVWLRDVVVAFLLLNWIVFSFLGFRLWRYARRVAPEKPTDDRVSSSELD